MDYSAFDKFIFRTPTLPLKELSIAFDYENITDTSKAIVDFFKNQVNQEALYIASPDLYHSFLEYQKGNIHDNEHGISIISSLLKYMVRMTTRATPFGLFAGCSIGELAYETNLELDSNLSKSKHTRLDMNYVCALAKEISKKQNIKNQLLFYPNTTLYTLGEKNRYIERKYNETEVGYHISQVDNDEYLQLIIDSSQNGLKILDLALLLVDDDISIDEAKDFIIELIDNQILVDELEPSVCGDEFFLEFIKVLKSLNPTTIFELNSEKWELLDFIKNLEEIIDLLLAIDKNDNNDIKKYEVIISILKSFGISFQTNRIFQTDLIRKTRQSTLSTDILKEAKICLGAINKLSSSSKNLKLDAFAKSFTEHYEEKELPLLQVLDTEFGIGYAQRIENQSQTNLNPVEQLLLEKVIDSIKKSSNVIEIADKELVDFKENWENTPDTMACMFQLLESKGNPVLYLSGIGGPNAANLLGRFCHADNAIEGLVNEIIEKEEALKSPNVIYGEINHITEARTGNILARPNLRKFEIPFLAKSTLGKDSQLNLSDLYISVRQGRIILRSQKNNKIVIPRLTNAHNYNYGKTQPVYQFLGDMQGYYDQVGTYFSWGKIEYMFNHLPRVVYKGHIFSRAKWAIKKLWIEKITQESIKNQADIIEKWRAEFQIPSKVILVEGDNELLVDLKNPLSVFSFIAMIKNKQHVLIEEYLYNEYASPVTNEQNHQFTNQILIPFYRNQIESTKHQLFQNLVPKGSIKLLAKREYLPGDEWVYFKIYCGNKTANEILTSLINPISNYLLNEKIINKWFFIRYADPDFHLRVRFKVLNRQKVGEVINYFYQIAESFFNNEQIKKIVIDTYSRELERYGNSTIDMSESLFFQNSKFVINFLEQFEDQTLIWLGGIKYIDGLLNSFGFNLKEKKEIMEGLSDGFGLEFNKDISLKKKLGNRFRTEREDIKKIIDAEPIEGLELELIVKLCDESLIHSAFEIETIKTINDNGELEISIENLVGSHIHMLLNKLFTENQRYHEMVLYHMMWHHYKSEFAREKSKVILEDELI